MHTINSKQNDALHETGTWTLREGKSKPTWGDQERLPEASGHLVRWIQMILGTNASSDIFQLRDLELENPLILRFLICEMGIMLVDACSLTCRIVVNIK